jgi:hypothetical protein
MSQCESCGVSIPVENKFCQACFSVEMQKYQQDYQSYQAKLQKWESLGASVKNDLDKKAEKSALTMWVLMPVMAVTMALDYFYPSVENWKIFVPMGFLGIFLFFTRRFFGRIFRGFAFSLGYALVAGVFVYLAFEFIVPELVNFLESKYLENLWNTNIKKFDVYAIIAFALIAFIFGIYSEWKGLHRSFAKPPKPPEEPSNTGLNMGLSGFDTLKKETPITSKKYNNF